MRRLISFTWVKLVDFVFDVLLSPVKKWLEREAIKQDILSDSQRLQDEFLREVVNRPKNHTIPKPNDDKEE